MKLLTYSTSTVIIRPAAFGRLCVETKANEERKAKMAPAAFGRLCVETPH